MPFDGYGNFTRDYNWTADKLANIKITSIRHDAEDDNFATAFNQVLLRNGVAPMTGDLKLGGGKITGIGSGTVAATALQFNADISTGVYLPAAGVLGFSAASVERGRFTNTGFSVTGKVGINTAMPRTPLDMNGGLMSIRGVFEDIIVAATALSGTLNVDVLTSVAYMFTLNASANFTFNVRGDGTNSLDSLMATGQMVTFAVEVPQGATPYYCTAITIGGAAPASIKWTYGAPTAGNASGIDVYLVRVIKTGDATFAVRASLSQER